MIKFLQNFSIKKKLIALQAFSSLSGLFFTTILLLVFEVTEFKHDAKQKASTMAELVGNRSTAALIFDDPTLAKENLEPLIQLASFHSACIYDSHGKVFASLNHKIRTETACPNQYSGAKTFFKQASLYVYEPIFIDSELIGTVYIFANLEQSFLRKLQSIGVLFIVLLAATVISFLLTSPLIGVITIPLNSLLNTVNKFINKKDYSLRAIKQGNDELGTLVDTFNEMIATVGQQHHALTAAKDHYQALYNDNPTMVFNLSKNRSIISVNQYGAKQLGLTCEELQGRSIFNFIHPDDKQAAQDFFYSCISMPKKVHKHEIRKICKNGQIIWVRESARVIINENEQYNFLLVCEDITETRLLSKKLAYQASHDSLTGLVNRNQFDKFLKLILEKAHNDQSEHVLCYLDLDQFKVVNDTSGHLAGDALLRQLGNVLRKQIRSGDVLARLGGDEFGIIMSHCSLNEAYQACEKLRNTIRGFQFAWEDRSFFIGVSIGLSSINNHSGNAVEILKEADSACYAAKENGRNRIHVFNPDDEELASRRGEMQWIEKIQHAIAKNQFILYGQRIVPTSDTEEGLHFETLIRYQDKQGNIIPPGAFLPAAERYNLAPALDKWVINNLFNCLSNYKDDLQHLSLCSVNLSGLSLSDESMLDFINNAFNKYSIPPEKICFEITETAAISNLNYASKFITLLRAKGCSFSLDDFGCGLSSFAYLKNLPVDFLKIDGLFVKDIIEDPVDRAMVKSIDEVGHIMNKKTIAEFVENDQIFNQLKDLGVDYAQGYEIAKPIPLKELLTTALSPQTFY
ncbi:MAG: EAL domain-containing protein [Methylococcales bacterium]|nr:EAL domain-containing protein [Methylococcales bacterium]